jgi:excisionase family DNA binding protein
VDRLLRTEEVAVRLGRSFQGVRMLMRDGTLPVVKMGPRMVRVRERDVEALVKRATVGGTVRAGGLTRHAPSRHGSGE